MEERRTLRVGLVTADGMWKEVPNNANRNAGIKILSFADRTYLAIARKWYQGLDALVSKGHF